MAQFHIQDLTFPYATASAPTLDHVSLTIEKGEYVVLCGQSGSSKTTLLRHLKSVLTPHGKRSGTLLFNGTPLEQVSQLGQSAKIGFVMQNPDDQIVTDKVWHELAFGLESLGVDQKTMRLRVAEMASYFGIQGWFHKNVTELSGGQKRRVALAGVIAMEPEVLVLDEPTAGLDPAGRENLMANIRDYHQNHGGTVILVSHSMDEIARNARRILVLKSAGILMEGTPGEVFARGDELLAAGLEVPQITRVAMELNRRGVNVGTGVYTVEELHSRLLALRKGGGVC